MKKYTLFILILLIFSLVKPVKAEDINYRFEYDIAMLAKIIEGLASDNHQLFVQQIKWYERLNPPEKLKLYHKEIIELSKELYNLTTAANITGPCPSQDIINQKIKYLMQKWIYLSNQLIPTYMNLGSSYVQDRGLYFLARKNLTNSIISMNTKLIMLSSQLKIKSNLCKNEKIISLTIQPNEIKAGQKFYIIINNNYSINGSIFLYVNNILIKTYIINESPTNITLIAPRYEDLNPYIRNQLEITKNIILSVELIGKSKNNTRMYGYSIGRLLFERPSIGLVCDKDLTPESNATVFILNKENYDFNVTLTINNIYSYNISISPGVTMLKIDRKLLNITGDNLVVLLVHGKGEFIPTKRLCTIKYQNPVYSLTVSYNPIALVGLVPIKVIIRANTNNFTSEIQPVIKVFVDGILRNETPINGNVQYLAVKPPRYYLPRVSTILLKVSYYGVNLTIGEGEIIVVNPWFLIFLLFILTLAVPYIGSPFEVEMKNTINNIYYLLKIKRQGIPKKPINIYLSLVQIISLFTEPPRPSETLREFYSRVKQLFSHKVSLILHDFIILYEKILYSKSWDNNELITLRNILKQLRRMIGL